LFIAAGRAFNASDACKELKCDSNELDALWAKAKSVCFSNIYLCIVYKKNSILAIPFVDTKNKTTFSFLG
jgi:hypothetical protein